MLVMHNSWCMKSRMSKLIWNQFQSKSFSTGFHSHKLYIIQQHTIRMLNAMTSVYECTETNAYTFTHFHTHVHFTWFRSKGRHCFPQKYYISWIRYHDCIFLMMSIVVPKMWMVKAKRREDGWWRRKEE